MSRNDGVPEFIAPQVNRFSYVPFPDLLVDVNNNKCLNLTLEVAWKYLYFIFCGILITRIIIDVI